MRPQYLFAIATLLALIVGNSSICAGEGSIKRSIDLDGDGKIEPAELRNAIRLILLEHGDKSHPIPDEARKSLNELNSRLDNDKDGFSDATEVHLLLHRLRAHHPKIFARVKEKLHELNPKQKQNP